jgi:thiamine transporter ThiT
MRSFLQNAANKACVCRSLKIALVVGTVNGLITQFDAVFQRTLTATNILQIVLTYAVPYCVATFSSAMQARYDELQALNKTG